MAAAIGIIVVGGLLVASGLKGLSITDLIGGVAGARLNPAGGRKTYAAAAADTSAADTAAETGGKIKGGSARGLVDSAVQIAQAAGGGGVFVVSAHRPGDPLDHGSNDANRAARDIAVRGVDAITGPPMPELDRAVIAIGKAMGRNYRANARIVDTFTLDGLRVQIIWRTPEYGGHMGHIHIGARRT